MRDAQDTLRGTVNVGAMASVEMVDLPALLGQLHARHPAIDVRLRLATTGSAGVAHALLSGDLDVAFLSLPAHKPAGIGARELATVPLVLAVDADHPLAQRGEVALADLAGEPLVLSAGLRQPRGRRPGVRGGGRRTPCGSGSARHRHGGGTGY
ncbi:LysR substrate-binding domain-containing protein [Streptomyces sp. NPDC001083]|uniref:LysR substrate-binding domain-containing protein n=1 Tax=unclassified Streptomyces TaxID=2593676 RepID=UPI0036818F12